MSAVTDACNIIKERLTSGVWPSGERLPSLIELAKQCTVSRSTMWRTLGLLQRESLVHANRGGAIIAGPVGATPREPATSHCAWERLMSRISYDILAGNLSEQRLPPASKLALRYGVSIGTLRKALPYLVRKGLLAREGAGFRLAQARSNAHEQSTVLISAGDRENGITIGDPRTESMVDNFERECIKKGYRYRFEGFNQASPAALLEVSSALKGVRDDAGYVVNLWNFWTEEYRQRWIDLLRLLVTRGKPVVAIDQIGYLDFPNDLPRMKNFRVLQIAGVRAGEQVAESLLRAGHTTIAYVMDTPDHRWSQLRYSGLTRVAKESGPLGAKIELFRNDRSFDEDTLNLAFMNLTKSEIRNLFRERLTSHDLQRLIGRAGDGDLPAIKTLVPQGMIARGTHATALALTSLARRKHDPWLLDQMLDRLLHVTSNTGRQVILEPLFKSMLEKSTASAWVCPTDSIALRALSFLRKQRKKVPDEISVIGFENWREAREQQLSSFDFNMAGMVQQALVMIRDDRTLKTQPPVCEVDGFLVERRTTKR